MNKNILKITSLLILILFSQVVFASGSRVGTAAAPELLIPMGARNVSLGCSDIANVTGTDAIYWNPAGLSYIKQAEATFSYLKYFADMNVAYIATGIKMGQLGAVGISIQSLNIGKIKVTTIEAPEGTGQEITPDYLTAGLTYSKKLTNKVAFGSNAKIISENIGNMSATAFAIDLGLQYHTEFGLDFGITMKNIGTDMKFDGPEIEFNSDIPFANPNATTRKTKLDMASNELPTSMNMGLAYTRKFSDAVAASCYGQYSKNTLDMDRMNLGGEVNLNNLLFLRAGYIYNIYPEDWEWDKDAQFNFSYGLGLNLMVSGTKVYFDYAFRPMELFDANQYFSISVGF
ncbi:MAG: PorV/PorQ family protein [Candidatus Marinimicrobia bacterium]|nr:PorV/PorQ family protein [Candidatus Neomarinimicrobiota bacterium]